MPTDPGTIPAIPTPVPTTTDPLNFDERGDATLAALPAVVAAMNVSSAATNTNAQEAHADALIAEDAKDLVINQSGLMALSTSNMSFTVSTKAVVLIGVSADIDFVDGEKAYAKRLSAPDQMMYGEFDNRAGLNIDFIVSSADDINGAGGPFNDWVFMSARFFDPRATKAQALAAASIQAVLVPSLIREVCEPYALGDAATLTGFDGENGLDFTVTITADRTIPALVNTYVGASGLITITNGNGGGWDLAFASGVFKRRGGPGTLAQTANQKTHMPYQVLAVDGSDIATEIWYDMIGNPTS